MKQLCFNIKLNWPIILQSALNMFVKNKKIKNHINISCACAKYRQNRIIFNIFKDVRNNNNNPKICIYHTECPCSVWCSCVVQTAALVAGAVRLLQGHHLLKNMECVYKLIWQKCFDLGGGQCTLQSAASSSAPLLSHAIPHFKGLELAMQGLLWV